MSSCPATGRGAFATKADAQAWERELWSQPATSRGDERIEDLVALWLAGERQVTPVAFRQYERAAEAAVAEFGRRHPGELTRAEVQAW